MKPPRQGWHGEMNKRGAKEIHNICSFFYKPLYLFTFHSRAIAHNVPAATDVLAAYSYSPVEVAEKLFSAKKHS